MLSSISLVDIINTGNIMFYTYVLRSKKDNKLYVGFCSDLKQRLIDHNKGEIPSTKSRHPMEIAYYEACLNKEKAIKREKYFKTGFGRNFLKNRI
ncbi:MAG: GIY-YIG catalytic domain protein [Candidatus Levybacteria bacterium GW2011_GWC1_40_19]|nr:MAG: GIY-YIG catalytic domain protein [Candidatus Levybacteria bacterium GW2011_GWA1_39_34]KKR50827.1 MAG: GIY-YIG catalytic domain protein [Candidatus Levybacteria bacterium GW2011_GWC1_40_19]KKR71865.1 MAG: GIY-YIG catalytic domain protein [Candidatus Levybacteria bacterium GW2011_GWC2_40_7]KKR95270.1 MAG: GIY-YIG catalytic domain protein [Candidatus Levybacteria bacterium GW2011_GWA2_41_15]KKS01774.1 MAG: GIY-YIG catalytic domain protein [Candidatus Levybacteria bacterium GW2011_GWB1_41_2